MIVIDLMQFVCIMCFSLHFFILLMFSKIEHRFGSSPIPDHLRLDKDALQRLLQHFHKRSYPAKTEIFTQGHTSDTLYYVIDGALTLVADENQSEKYKRSSSTDDTNKELAVHYINAGDFVGESGFFKIEGRPEYVSLRSRSAVEIAEIGHQELASLLNNELQNDAVKILYALGAQLSKRLMSATQKASGMAFVEVTERVLRAVFELARLPDALTHPQGMQIKVSRQELAKLSGCSREMAGRALKDLESAGKLTAYGKTVVVFGTR